MLVKEAEAEREAERGLGRALVDFLQGDGGDRRCEWGVLGRLGGWKKSDGDEEGGILDSVFERYLLGAGAGLALRGETLRFFSSATAAEWRTLSKRARRICWWGVTGMGWADD